MIKTDNKENYNMDIRKFRSTLGQHPLAYMSAEFGLDDRLPIYSGGLGVLAGDIIREAGDMNLPFVGVGLLYKEGYFKQEITDDGEQKAVYPLLDTGDAPIKLIVNTKDERITVQIPMSGEDLTVQVWEYMQEDVSVYLLDTDLPSNNNEYRFITRQLYGGNIENRMLQEMVLGIGGVKFLMKLGIHPSLYHLNESHSSFAIIEIVHHYMVEYGMSFAEAYEYSRNKIVFTNHTLVPAGNEVFDRSLVETNLKAYTESLGLAIDEVLDRGMVPGEENQFAMSTMALAMSSRINTVSQLHAEKAKEVWPDFNMPGITNGVHLPTWVSADFKAQAPWFETSVIEEMDNDEFWIIHQMAKHRLIDEVKYLTDHQLNKDHLIVTWARRIATYKRPGILFEDMQAMVSLVKNEERPVQILMAGKAHPNDQEGQAIIKNIHQAIKEHGLEESVVFIPNYSMSIAKFLVTGSDVWLNTPIRGREASGTSGMKASANGVLTCSISDGWVDEADIPTIGWEISDDNVREDLYRLLNEEIVPLYYERSADNLPEKWIELMKANMVLVWKDFSATRMLDQYIDILYRPVLELEIKEKHEHNWRQNYRSR